MTKSLLSISYISKMVFDSGKQIHSRLVGVALDCDMHSALWVLKLSYLFDFYLSFL